MDIPFFTDEEFFQHCMKYLEGDWDFSDISPVFMIRFSGRACK